MYIKFDRIHIVKISICVYQLRKEPKYTEGFPSVIIFLAFFQVHQPFVYWKPLNGRPR